MIKLQQSVDLSSGLSQVFNFIATLISEILDFLGSIYIFQNVSVLHLLVALVILGMIVSAVFVLFDGDLGDD